MTDMKVLLFNVPDHLMDRADGILARPPFVVEECSLADELRSRVEKNRYYLMILNLPVKGFDPREILYTLRHQKRASSDSILILLAPDDILPEYRVYINKGISALFPHSTPCAEIENAIARLTHIAPRVDSRIIVRLKAKTQLGHRVVLCQALNLSFTGMFVATSMTFPVGSDVLFELMLPQARFPLEGEARVVRHSSGLREHSIGMGLTFLSFKHDGAEALRALVERSLPASDGEDASTTTAN